MRSPGRASARRRSARPRPARCWKDPPWRLPSAARVPAEPLEPGGEGLQDVAVEALLERDDQVGQLLRLRPFPGAEFRLGRFEVHVPVLAEEAGEEPGLALPAPFALPDLPEQIVGQ